LSSKHCLLLDVDLELFLRFNKIRALVDNTKLLAKALSKSEVLQVIGHILYFGVTIKVTGCINLVGHGSVTSKLAKNIA